MISTTRQNVAAITLRSPQLRLEQSVLVHTEIQLIAISLPPISIANKLSELPSHPLEMREQIAILMLSACDILKLDRNRMAHILNTRPCSRRPLVHYFSVRRKVDYLS